MEPETDLVCNIVDNRKEKAAVHQQQGPQLPCVQAFKQGSETMVTAAAGIEQVVVDHLNHIRASFALSLCW